MSKKKKKIALLDFDGTLSRGYISMDFLKYLFEHHAYPEEFYQQQKQVLKEYQAKQISYEGWCEKWGVLWARGLKGKRVKDIEFLANNLFRIFKANIYSSSYQLIKLLKRKEYHTVLVGTGAVEVVNTAGADLGIDEVHATTILSRRGIYVGRLTTDFHKPKGKRNFVERFIKSGKFDLTTSIAFGDSPHDAGMFGKVKFPIALNPSKEMLSLAAKNKWIILNYKNVVGYFENFL